MAEKPLPQRRVEPPPRELSRCRSSRRNTPPELRMQRCRPVCCRARRTARAQCGNRGLATASRLRSRLFRQG
eukprot:5883197-Pleurochrysis_carterae.AAC.2